MLQLIPRILSVDHAGQADSSEASPLVQRHDGLLGDEQAQLNLRHVLVDLPQIRLHHPRGHALAPGAAQ